MANVANLLVAYANIWYAPVGEALPNPNSVGVGADWGGNWASVGYTNAPFSMGYTATTRKYYVEQENLPVAESIEETAADFETQLAEITADNLKLAMGGSKSTTAAGASQVGLEELQAGGATALDEYTWGVEGYRNINNVLQPVRIQIWRGTAVLNGRLTFAKGEMAGIPLRISGLVDASKPVGQRLIRYQAVTEAATE
ncbi:MAG: hypothetical protein KF832_31080 [Caldilineaceae bacterium]|nr:hypothetical protein [Caldilineaceae bacterium]